MGTTPNGFPYPEDTDVVQQGAQGIKALATAVDTRARASAAGSVTIAVNTSTTAFSKAVTFPPGRFTTPPAVVASVSMSWYVASVSGVTATGCTITIRNVTTGTETTNRVAYWSASAIG
jgi:hypothetical protein